MWLVPRAGPCACKLRFREQPGRASLMVDNAILFWISWAYGAVAQDTDKAWGLRIGELILVPRARLALAAFDQEREGRAQWSAWSTRALTRTHVTRMHSITMYMMCYDPIHCHGRQEAHRERQRDKAARGSRVPSIILRATGSRWCRDVRVLVYRNWLTSPRNHWRVLSRINTVDICVDCYLNTFWYQYLVVSLIL